MSSSRHPLRQRQASKESWYHGLGTAVLFSLTDGALSPHPRPFWGLSPTWRFWGDLSGCPAGSDGAQNSVSPVRVGRMRNPTWL